ncbi:hypothetical protein VTN77DRAFT_8883 [Rasamsonia byssochlamydoides]|uniref:uncharacterized protein n=1 Tax=Rasamsonia byssochlamydoides TaxID=89139 RepID=UPI003742F42B
MNALFIVQLILYVLLSVPVCYILRRHGWPGFLGWAFLLVFCAFRIVGGGFAINNTGTGADILASLGLGPLLLAVNGVLTEARTYRKPDVNIYLHWFYIAVITAIVAAGLAEAGTGAAALGGGHPNSDDVTNAAIGLGLFFATWVILVGWGLFQLKLTQQRGGAPAFREGTVLLYAVLASLLFLGIRVTYGLVAVSTKKGSLNPITGSLAVRVLLGFLPEVILTGILVYAGFKTKEVNRIPKAY